MYTYVEDRLWGKMLTSIDNAELYRCCLHAEEHHLKSFIKEEEAGVYGNKTSASYEDYNLLSLPYIPFQDLYHRMVDVIKPCLPDETHVLQCWVNIYRAGERVQWHGHWPPKYRSIHGFYCVHVTPSYTEYQFNDIPGMVYTVESKEGLLVFGKSDNDSHQSSLWHDDENPRVTIAFDIVPIATLENRHLRINHFLPF